MIRLGREVCIDLKDDCAREWLETNGIGGFASSTITGLNARRHHGLLVAAVSDHSSRMVLLSKVEETLVIGDQRFALSVNRFPDVIHLQGHLYLKEFRLDPFPIFTYEVEGVEIIKSVFMVYGENTTVIQYERRGGAVDNCSLEVRPLIAFRDQHSATRENSALDPRVRMDENLASVAPYDGLPALHIAHDAGPVEVSGYWYRNFHYQVERERGLDFEEDLFNPLTLRFDLSRRPEASIIASTERREIIKAAEYRRAEIERRAGVIAAAPVTDGLVRSLVAAADQYIVERGDRKRAIAGYHWLGDRARDTMIALPGLTLVTGRVNLAQDILRDFALRVIEAPEPDSVEATLWYFEAARGLLDYTGDYEFVRARLYAAMIEIIDRYGRGARDSVRVDADGLLDSSEEGTIKSRHGKAVEVQALWYNALRVAEDVARNLSDDANERRFRSMAARAKRSFNDLFWYDEAECLFDVVRGDMRDGSIRPNQILAISLGHTMLPRERARHVVRVVERELLTPYGLRSLAPGDHHYIGRYRGDTSHRDEAYHQGTVHAWLMGPFITAFIKVNNQSADKANRARARAAEMLAAFERHLSDAGLGHISELFDAEIPYTPRGCIAQAASVAELLRASVEDVFNLKPAKREPAIAIK